MDVTITIPDDDVDDVTAAMKTALAQAGETWDRDAALAELVAQVIGGRTAYVRRQRAQQAAEAAVKRPDVTVRTGAAPSPRGGRT